MSSFFEIVVLCFGFVSAFDNDLINGADGDSGARNISASTTTPTTRRRASIAICWRGSDTCDECPQRENMGKSKENSHA